MQKGLQSGALQRGIPVRKEVEMPRPSYNPQEKEAQGLRAYAETE